jgi:serine/threonine protein kinase
MGGCASSAPQGGSDFHKDYILSKKLGEGSFAQVFLCKERENRYQNESGGKLAVKVLDVSAGGVRKEARKEAQLWQKIADGPNVVQLVSFFEDTKFCYIVMERCHCTVLQAFLEEEDCGEEDLGHCFRGMLEGLQFIHSRGVVHRDVKPDNFLLESGTKFSQDSVVKLCDFGLAAALPTKTPAGKGLASKAAQLAKSSALTSICGTAPYMAPEMLTPTKEGYGTAVDLWSMGVAAYLMLFGEFPYRPPKSGSKEMMETIKAGKQPPTFQARPGFPQPSNSACAFVRDLLVRTPQFRPDADIAKHNPFITKVTKPNVVESATKEESPRLPGYIRSDGRKQSFHQTLMVAKDVANKMEHYKVQGGDVVRFPTPECKKSFEDALMEMQREHGTLRNSKRTMSDPSQTLRTSFSNINVEVPVALVKSESIRSKSRLNTHSGSYRVPDNLKGDSDDSDGKSTAPSDTKSDTSRDMALLKEPEVWRCRSDADPNRPTTRSPQSL